MGLTRILVTSDDGIHSPGLRAAVEVLIDMGEVTVVAPFKQQTSMGRSYCAEPDAGLVTVPFEVNGTNVQAYGCECSPAVAIRHGMDVLFLDKNPDLVVAGINYGENLGVGITVSGTVGAAMEGAGHGIPALAVSLETDQKDHLSYSTEVNFSTAAHFTQIFGRMMLQKRLPADVDLLKVDVPCDASPDTPWEITRLSKQIYFESVRPKRTSWDQPETVGYRRIEELSSTGTDTDVYALRVKRVVSVTPISLDLTSRVNLDDFDQLLREA